MLSGAVDEGGVTSEFGEASELLLSSPVTEAACDHSQMLSADQDFIEREMEALHRASTDERELIGVGVGSE